MTTWTVAHQVPLPKGISRKEYWSGLPFPSPGNLPDPGNEAGSPALQTDSLPTELCGKPRTLGAETKKKKKMVLQSHMCINVCGGARLCLILGDPMDCNRSVFSVYGIFPARTLEWVVTPSSRGSSRPRNQTRVSCIGRWILCH